jgi:hypothetical protein
MPRTSSEIGLFLLLTLLLSSVFYALIINTGHLECGAWHVYDGADVVPWSSSAVVLLAAW